MAFVRLPAQRIRKGESKAHNCAPDGAVVVAWAMYRGVKYSMGTPAPLPYCQRHRLHENPVPGTIGYCPWLDPEKGPKLRAMEEAIDLRRKEGRLAQKLGLKGSAAILAKMGLKA